MTTQQGGQKKGLFSFSFLVAAFITSILVAAIEFAAMRSTGGVFMYPLDDPFIHMDIAQHLAFDHTWGINPGEFASASSSLLYTVMLAVIFKIFSVHVVVPFIINLIAGFILLWVMDRWFERQQFTRRARMIGMIIMILAIPLPIMIISGMEHTLQCLFCFLFITKFVDWINNATLTNNWKLPWALVVYAVLVTTVRYEGIFLVGVACLYLLTLKKISQPIIIGFISLLPIVIFGLISLSLNSYFFPNSVVIKSDSIQWTPTGLIKFLNNILTVKYTGAGVANPGISLITTQRLMIILPVLLLLKVKSVPKGSTLMSVIVLATLLLHVALAATGWFYRYEAYLIMMGMLIFINFIYHASPTFFKGRTWIHWAAITVLSFAIFFPFVLRTSAAFSRAYRACTNIYEQQFQMSEFIKQYYNGRVVGANDIGAIGLRSSATLIDLWGLGSIDIAKSKKENRWTPEFIDGWVRQKHTVMAVVYDKWFDQKLLNKWVKVASWTVQDNVTLGDDTVYFYAIEPQETLPLKKNLQLFESKLPRTVTVAYY